MTCVTRNFSYGNTTKTLKSAYSDSVFVLELQNGSIHESEIVVLLGENGVGKSTFISLMAGRIDADGDPCSSQLPISYMAPVLRFDFEGTVSELLQQKIAQVWTDPQFKSIVIEPMKIEGIMAKSVKELSTGDIQRILIVLTLGQPAELYLLDEPLAHLDVEQRMIAADVVKKFIRCMKKAAFIVEHDLMMASYMADAVVVFEGTPGTNCVALSPMGLFRGMNHFLRRLDVTMRRQSVDFVPRINKSDSIAHKNQKKSGDFFFWDD